MTHSEKARELFMQGYNCSQAVFGAFCDVTGVDFDTAVRISSSFGGGMGRMREVCGAVSGMFMVAGILYSSDDPKNNQLKSEHYARIQELAGVYRQSNGSIICRELLGLGGKDSSPNASPRTAEYYKKRPCADLVAEAAQIMDDYIAAHPITQKS